MSKNSRVTHWHKHNYFTNLFKKYSGLNKDFFLLFLIWLISVIIDRIWFNLDHSMPAWDQADYLNGVKIYSQALKEIDIFNGDWWRNFWLLSNKIPPLTYIVTAPFFLLLNISEDSATLILSCFNLLLLISLYYLGKLFFNSAIALFACALVTVIPGLYFYRLEFLLDFPLSAIVTFSFTCLSYWYFAKSKGNFSWVLAIVWGLSLGMALMIKQPALFFLFFPVLFVLIDSLLTKKWLKLAQLIVSLFVSTLIFYPWYRTNWLLIFTSGKRATIDSAIAEGDPSLNTLKAWTYYAEVLPYLLSWILVIVPAICLIYLLIKYLAKYKLNLSKLSQYLSLNFYQIERKKVDSYPVLKISLWLLTFLIGGYLLSSVNINKDARYILPLVPVLSLILSALVFAYQGKFNNYFRVFIISICSLLMLLNLFPLGGTWLTKNLSPQVEHYPYTGEKWANPLLIEEVVKTAPYLRSNVGVLPSTPQINQHNTSFLGAINNVQVFGRQVGTRKRNYQQDVYSMDWFLTKTGEQGSIPETQKDTVKLVKNSQLFKIQNSWQLPDQSELRLHYRQQPLNQVTALNSRNSKVKLAEILVNPVIGSGQKIPITYQWSGSGNQLKNGIVILTWFSANNPQQKWIHDHGFAMGNIHQGKMSDEEFAQDLLVTENTAMFVPDNLAEGKYFLEAIYLDRKTGETYPIDTNNFTLEIKADSTEIVTIQQLDLVTQIRGFAPNLKDGIDGLDPIFAEVERINQYDPIQDYLKVTEKSLQYRLQTEKNLDYFYTLLLAQALQQNVQSAIATAQEIVKFAPDNIYNHAYLAFIYLYDWQGKNAEKALQPALEMQPDLDIVQYLQGVSAIMQGNLWKAWQVYQRLQELDLIRVS